MIASQFTLSLKQTGMSSCFVWFCLCTCHQTSCILAHVNQECAAGNVLLNYFLHLTNLRGEQRAERFRLAQTHVGKLGLYLYGTHIKLQLILSIN